jgi:hypothetical protein
MSSNKGSLRSFGTTDGNMSYIPKGCPTVMPRLAPLGPRSIERCSIKMFGVKQEGEWLMKDFEPEGMPSKDSWWSPWRGHRCQGS